MFVTVDEVSLLRGVCLWQGQYFANYTNWPHGCNTCSCFEGEVQCTRIWCGLGNCLGISGANCGDNQVSTINIIHFLWQLN